VFLLRYAGLQLEVARRIVPGVRREDLDNYCRSYRRASWEAAQSRSSPDKWLLREEGAERRGASAKRSLSEDVAQQIHPFIHQSLHPLVQGFMSSLIHGFTDSLIGSVVHELVH